MRIDEFLLARVAEDEARASAIAEFVGPSRDGRPQYRGIGPRVLAECEAKRRVVAGHGRQRDRDWCRTCAGPAGREDDWPCPTILALANIYADHPDFDPAWRL